MVIQTSTLKYLYLLSMLPFLYAGCGDNSISKLYDTSYKNRTIPCLKLSVFPRNKNMEKYFKKLYPFKQKCEYILLVSYKAGIVCNSNQNAPRKTLSNFPNSYLRMEINRNMNDLIYSYYIDLNDKVSKDDIENGLKNIKKNLKFN